MIRFLQVIGWYGTVPDLWNVVMTGAVVAALPTALIYVFLGRYFIRGMLAGSVKG